MGYKIIITKYKNSILSCMTDGKKLVQMNFDPLEGQHIFGNVYVGKVKNIVKNIKAAFVEISEGTNCYLSLDKYEPPIFIKHGNTDEIRVGDELLVQVSREGLKSKAPTVTTGINLTGRYLVLSGQDKNAAVSKKIEDSAVRKRLKKLAASLCTEQSGVILRTNAAEVSEELLIREAQNLQRIYGEILQKGQCSTCFSCVYEAIPAFLGTLRDSYEGMVDEFITDDKELFQRIHRFLEEYQREDLDKLSFHDGTHISLDAKYSIQSGIDTCIREKVWLKSGGSIIIQPTEALTVIDVNTEKAIKGKSSVQEHFFKVNMEAAEEIAYQLRLRNITGIIMIDFIDMNDVGNRRSLMQALVDYVKPDPVKTTVVDMTALNLVELTRQKTRKPVLEQLKELGCSEIVFQKNNI